ncbi:MAG: ATP-binding cassette domain-containing protein [Bdellovibrionales bacterium]
MTPAITVDNLQKEFVQKTHPPDRGFWQRLLKSAEIKRTPAVAGLSFSIQPGERVAFIGPNGAGKSTTLKMLSGILTPTDGTAHVAGLVPWDSRQALARHIGLVFGQRSQLWYHLSVNDSFNLLAAIYDLKTEDYATQRAWLEETFQLAPLWEQQVKALSLGQRMRAEIAASLLHKPQILFLDEPTIGLDITVRAELRDTLKRLSQRGNVTIILTSHDMADVEEVCDRIILINHGRKVVDDTLASVKHKFVQTKRITLITEEETPVFSMPGIDTERSQHKLALHFNPTHVQVAHVISAAMAALNVRDVVIEDTPLEDIIQHIYRQGLA